MQTQQPNQSHGDTQPIEWVSSRKRPEHWLNKGWMDVLYKLAVLCSIIIFVYMYR